MVQMMDVILIALFIEVIVDCLKPLWKEGEKPLSLSEMVAMAMGIVLAVACRINMLDGLLTGDYPAWVLYIFYGFTGIAMGRGTNFLYDLWAKMKKWNDGKILDGDDVEELTDSLLRSILRDFGASEAQISAAKTRKELEILLDGYVAKGTEPPTSGGAE